MTQHPALARGRLGRTLANRHGGLRKDLEPTLRIEHREALIYTLGDHRRASPPRRNRAAAVLCPEKRTVRLVSAR